MSTEKTNYEEDLRILLFRKVAHPSWEPEGRSSTQKVIMEPTTLLVLALYSRQLLLSTLEVGRRWRKQLEEPSHWV